MRTKEEIEGDIRKLYEERSRLHDDIKKLEKERADVMFAEFCEKNNLKAGDIVKTKGYGTVEIVGIETKSWGSWITVRKIKKNGEPYAVTTTLSQKCFDGCACASKTKRTINPSS